MSSRSEHGGGEKAMRDEQHEAERAETERADRLLARWRLFIRNLKEIADGP